MHIDDVSNREIVKCQRKYIHNIGTKLIVINRLLTNHTELSPLPVPLPLNDPHYNNRDH